MCLLDSPPMLRVAIVGNSNSIGPRSYAGQLANRPGVSVTNRSIGATPNVVLLDFLACETEWDYDFVILETAVVDCLQQGWYSYERALETLELTIRYIKAVSVAQIIILVIPTFPGLLRPKMFWQRSLYNEIAFRFSLPILDGYQIISKLVGTPKFDCIDIFTKRAEVLVSAFRLPGHFFEHIAWRSLRESHVTSNALGVFAHIDTVHYNPELHNLMADLLQEFMGLPVGKTDTKQTVDRTALSSILIASEPAGGEAVVRANSLISRALSRLRSGDTVKYHCPPGYRAYGLLTNEANTSGYVHIKSPAGSTTFDMRVPVRPSEWRAVIAQILDPVGEGEIEITILEHPTVPDSEVRTRIGAGTPSPTVIAELGELILVKTDWSDVLPAAVDQTINALRIEELSWAKPVIAAAASRFDTMIQGIEAGGRFIGTANSNFIASILARVGGGLSFGDQARLMLVMGMKDEVTRFLEAVCVEHPDNIELKHMLAGICAVKADESVSPDDIISRARALLRAGETTEGEAVLLEGMARFGSNAGIYFEHAWIPCHQGHQGDWKEAVRRWQSVYDQFFHHPASHVGLAFSLRESGQLVEAERVITGAILQFPASVEAAAHHAYIAIAMNDAPEALRRLRSVRHRFPDFLENRRKLIDFLIQQENFDEALVEIRDFFVRGETASAFGQAEILLARAPDHTGAMWLLSDIHAREERFSEAVALARRVVDATPTDQRAREHLARILTQSGDLDAARIEAEQILTVAPERVAATLLMSDIAGRQKQFEEAIALARKVIVGEPTNLPAREHLAHLLTAAGDLALALDEAKTVLVGAPDHKGITHLMANIKAKIKAHIKVRT
jgi:Flp pilus assembly protein TadD